MASGLHCQMEMELQIEDLRKKLAKAVRCIQWSYAIFWSISPTQPGVIKWVDGYYNGDIKTRKTVDEAANGFSTDELGLQRSDQLRELFNSLSKKSSGRPAKRPSASLSPEDLSDTEWYYLVCMSFVFKIGEGLPGRTLASGEPIWLCNAPQADSKLFCRSLLAKSASIQTVVCFPFSDGVIELGVTETVREDPSLIQHLQISFLITTPYLENTLLEYNPIQADYNATVEYQEANICGQSSDLFMIEGLNLEPSDQVQSFLLVDNERTNDFHDSMSSSECMSQNLIDSENLVSIPIAEKENEKISFFQANEVHYQGVVSTLLKSSHKLIMGSYFQECDKGSSFMRWNKGKFLGTEMDQIRVPQKLLKKVLFEVAQMHSGSLREYKEDNNERKEGIFRPEIDELVDLNHVLAKRRRRERLSERFSVLESLVPSTSKVDKVSILENTIEYIRELERRVEDLDSSEASADTETRTRRSQCRRNTAGYNNETSSQNNQKRIKPLINKRKSCDIGELEDEKSNYDVNVGVFEKDVLIEIKCPWRECLLFEIIDEISRLQLDSHAVQSKNTDNMLSVTIQSKLKGYMRPARGIIKQAIQRVIEKC